MKIISHRTATVVAPKPKQAAKKPVSKKKPSEKKDVIEITPVEKIDNE